MGTFNVRLWSKPATQTFIKKLREAGYRVDREPNGKYTAWHLEGMPGGDVLVFSALPGSRGYLCRVNSDYCEGLNEDIASAR